MNRKISMIQRLKTGCVTVLYYCFRIFPIKKNKILIRNYYGKGFGDNAKYIALELLKQKQAYDIVWEVADMNVEMPEGIRKTPYRSLRGLYDICTARVWLDNCRKGGYVRKRKGQYYIQLWHGDIGIKKVERHVEMQLTPEYVEAAKNDSRMADLFVSGSKHLTRIYKDAFWYDGEIAEVGSPRCDILTRDDASQKQLIRNKLGIGDDIKIVLYAPTFRNSGDDMSEYKLPWGKLLKALEERFGGNWMGALRLHPNVSEFSNKLDIPDNVVDVTLYDDMQELLLISDCLISDYSSCLYEFARTGKIGFIFATDYESYKKERDGYFTLDDTPFLVAEDEDSLIHNISVFNEDEYESERKVFFEEKFGSVITDKSSIWVAERISSVIRN